MQINDALFPTGGYTHSYGLETYIEHKKITSAEEVEQYIHQNMKTSFLYSELLAASLAYDAAKEQNLQKLIELDNKLTVSKMPLELRKASYKLGVRLIKMIQAICKEELNAEFKAYCKKSKQVNRAIAYGAFVGSSNFNKELALAFFCYSMASGMVTNCVKSIPLSQTVGQCILYKLSPVFEELIEACKKLKEEDLARSTPGLDIASMQHEILYSRLYMS